MIFGATVAAQPPPRKMIDLVSEDESQIRRGRRQIFVENNSALPQETGGINRAAAIGVA
jgi:hypothetical protein